MFIFVFLVASNICFGFTDSTDTIESHLTKYNKPVYEKCNLYINEDAVRSDSLLGEYITKENECLKKELAQIIKQHLPSKKWQEHATQQLGKSLAALDAYTFDLANFNKNCQVDTNSDSYSCGTWGRYIIPATHLRLILLDMIHYTYSILYYYGEPE